MITIPDDFLKKCYALGIEAYPDEACGILSGPQKDPATLDGFHAMENTLGKLHALDPERYPRTPREGYVLDPRAYMKLERSLEENNQAIRVVYHSHVDVGAYFSAEDKKQATFNGQPVLPGIYYLVCGIKENGPDGAIVVSFNDKTGDFEETRIDEPAAS